MLDTWCCLVITSAFAAFDSCFALDESFFFLSFSKTTPLGNHLIGIDWSIWHILENTFGSKFFSLSSLRYVFLTLSHFRQQPLLLRNYFLITAANAPVSATRLESKGSIDQCFVRRCRQEEWLILYIIPMNIEITCVFVEIAQ